MFFGSTKEFPSLIFYQLRLKISFSPKIEGAKNIKQAQFGLHRKWRLMEYRRVFPIGQGTYSSVYNARDLLNNNKMVALKKITRLDHRLSFVFSLLGFRVHGSRWTCLHSRYQVLSASEDYWRKLKLPPSAAFKPALPCGQRVAEMFKDLPMNVLSLLEALLSIDPEQRGSAAIVLETEELYFRTEPFACDPSSLPKYPPSKEIDAKIRDEAKRQQRSAQEKKLSDKTITRKKTYPAGKS
ncbi:hypothetical protein Bca4012_008373 [Brassica carinata]